MRFTYLTPAMILLFVLLSQSIAWQTLPSDDRFKKTPTEWSSSHNETVSNSLCLFLLSVIYPVEMRFVDMILTEYKVQSLWYDQ